MKRIKRSFDFLAFALDYLRKSFENSGHLAHANATSDVFGPSEERFGATREAENVLDFQCWNMYNTFVITLKRGGNNGSVELLLP